MAIIITVLVTLLASATNAAQSTFDVVVSGKSCAMESRQEIHCEYKVGAGLHFSIENVGGLDTGITFLRSSFKGDFYAKFGILHGCVIVVPGPESRVPGAIDGPGSFLDFAFVSPKNGKVYRDWRDCQGAY